MLESVRASKYDKGAGLIAVARFTSGDVWAANVIDMLVHSQKERFLNNRCSLATVDDRPRRLCTQKLAKSEQPDIK